MHTIQYGGDNVPLSKGTEHWPILHFDYVEQVRTGRRKKNTYTRVKKTVKDKIIIKVSLLKLIN
jgi:hypothetical protein